MSSKSPRIDAVRFVQILAASLALCALASSAHGGTSDHQVHSNSNDSFNLATPLVPAVRPTPATRPPGEPLQDSYLMIGNTRMLNTRKRFGRPRKKRRAN